VGKQKQPYHIHTRSGGLFAIASLWDVWKKCAEPVESCSNITTTANEATRQLRERMPVILDREHFTPLGGAVGSVRNDGPEMVAPAAAPFTR
jgi:putative SOS response-associated peptidase YedK